VKETTIEQLAPLLRTLRANSALREIRPAVFHLDGRDFLHFHEEDAGIVADVRLTTRFVRMPVSSETDQGELLEQIDEHLDALESRELDRQRRGRRSGC